MRGPRSEQVAGSDHSKFRVKGSLVSHISIMSDPAFQIEGQGPICWDPFSVYFRAYGHVCRWHLRLHTKDGLPDPLLLTACQRLRGPVRPCAGRRSPNPYARPHLHPGPAPPLPHLCAPPRRQLRRWPTNWSGYIHPCPGAAPKSREVKARQRPPIGMRTAGKRPDLAREKGEAQRPGLPEVSRHNRLDIHPGVSEQSAVVRARPSWLTVLGDKCCQSYSVEK